MKRYFLILTGILVMTVFTAQAADSTKSMGWISDSMCGAKHASGTKADQDCVTKCIAGGMKPVFVDAKKRIWSIDNPDAVKGYYGDHVTVTATENASSKSMHIDTIASAK